MLDDWLLLFAFYLDALYIVGLYCGIWSYSSFSASHLINSNSSHFIFYCDSKAWRWRWKQFRNGLRHLVDRNTLNMQKKMFIFLIPHTNGSLKTYWAVMFSLHIKIYWICTCVHELCMYGYINIKNSTQYNWWLWIRNKKFEVCIQTKCDTAWKSNGLIMLRRLEILNSWHPHLLLWKKQCPEKNEAWTHKWHIFFLCPESNFTFNKLLFNLGKHPHSTVDFIALTCDWSRVFLLLYEHLIIIGVLAINNPCGYPMEVSSGPPVHTTLLSPVSVHLCEFSCVTCMHWSCPDSTKPLLPPPFSCEYCQLQPALSVLYISISYIYYFNVYSFREVVINHKIQMITRK